MSELTTAEKSEAIIRKIVEICNGGENVEFEEDFGGNTLTVILKKVDGSGGCHTHVGIPGSKKDDTFEVLVDHLYNTLHGGPGLSWA